MINGSDRVIRALYLAKTDNREQMLSVLIQNVLYNFNDGLTIDGILTSIESDFNLQPIRYELEEAIASLISDSLVETRSHKYTLTDTSKLKVHESILKNKELDEKRYDSFKRIIKEISSDEFLEHEFETVWTVFNEYLLDCFLEFGRNAIDIFLPYTEDKLPEDHSFSRAALRKLDKDKLCEIFKKLVVEYPNRLSASELRYLTLLAERAERFYSLGIEKEQYEKIKDLQLKNVIVLVDTNFLYSALSLRYHRENNAIYEIIHLTKQKRIDVRLTFLRKTYQELKSAKQELEYLIPDEKLTISQIKALLKSNRLEGFAKQYYENKLVDSQTPHPSYRIQYSQEKLRYDGIEVYNYEFKQLDENASYLNAKITAYLDYQKFINEIREEKGISLKLNKSDRKIEHDIYLREAIIHLKNRHNATEDIQFVCLTLDNNLIKFDHYEQRKPKGATNEVFNPNFLLPSIFLKKIRPFIPIVTNDYRKAFLSAITVNTFESDDRRKSVLIQKSMSFFKALGIDDEQAIVSCIKKEMFLDEFETSLDENIAEDFIKSSFQEYLEKINGEKRRIEEEKIAQKNGYEEALRIAESQRKDLEEEKQIIKKSGSSTISTLEKELHVRDKEIESLSRRIEVIELERKREGAALELKAKVADWNGKRMVNVRESTQERIRFYKKCSWIFVKSIAIISLPIIATSMYKLHGEPIRKFLLSCGVQEFWVYIVLTSISVVEIVYRSFLADKEKMKYGWRWILTCFSKANRERLIQEIEREMISEFEREFPKPKLL